MITLNINNIDVEITPYDTSYTGHEKSQLTEASIESLFMYMVLSDWLVLREIEQGIPMPDHMRENRKNVRAKIQELQDSRVTEVQEI